MQTSGGSVSDRRLFTTALYHCLLHPTLVSDVDGRYPGFDGAVHRLPAGRRQYSAVSGWDAYRTQLPLIAWIRPDVASDVVRSLQRAARQGGWLPRWPLVASYTGVMNGDSAAPVIASAYAFGARSFGLGTAVSQLVRNAEVTDAQPGQGWFQPRPGASDYLRLGYVPNTTPERGWLQPHGASTTLEYAVDDFAVSRLAAAAGRAAVASRFRQRSGSWRSLLDDTRDLLLPREPGGAFPGAGYDPAACCDGFQEGNAVQYSWMVPHDMAGLLHRLGARAATIERLAEFHTQLNAGAGRPFAWMGNQPSLATPWAYLWLREPSRTADVVAHVRDQLWTGGSDGIPGNDDLGGLSAWYVWASLGLYPLVPGTAVTAVGPPAFAQVVVRPSQGPLTTLERRGDGAHVRAVRVDGVARSSSWLSLAPARRPDKVIVATTGSRRPAWGTGPNDVPPSFPAR
jgi:predicted alpha-1,2-mannosidase